MKKAETSDPDSGFLKEKVKEGCLAGYSEAELRMK
jgi:hypothetical protein